MLHCGDPSFGGAMYGCPHCGKLKFVPFRCHSRFCPTCGNKYSMERTTNMSFKLIHTTHRHCVFTIDQNLRRFFLRDRSLLNCLFHAVTSVISKNAHPFLRSFNKWRVAILGAFGYDPLKCPDCGHEMDFFELYFNHQRISLEEIYENVMSKSRRKRSSP